MNGGHSNAQYNLRLPDDLKQKIAQPSKELNRSMNTNIVVLLEGNFVRKAFDKLDFVPLEKLLAIVMKNHGEKSSLQLTSREYEQRKK